MCSCRYSTEKPVEAASMDEDLMNHEGFSAAAEEAVMVSIGTELDLHHFAPRDVLSVVSEYLAAAKSAGLRELRIIHGKGIGYQRQQVRTLLATNPLVAAYGDCPAGGKGATLVTLQ